MMCLVTDNYQYLNTVALRITKDKTVARDLICETYLEMHDKGKQPDNVKVFCRAMKLCYKPNGHFNKQKFKEVLTEVNDYLDEQEQSDEDKYKEIQQFKDSLSLIEQILFEIHFEHGKSCQQIADLLESWTGYKTSKSLIKTMIKPIRIKLKLWEWKS